MTPLRELAQQAAADAQGDVREAWPTFSRAAMAAEAEGLVNFFEEFPDPRYFPAVFAASGDALRRAQGDRELAAALLHEQLDPRENPTIFARIYSERRANLWLLLMNFLRVACEDFKKRSE